MGRRVLLLVLVLCGALVCSGTAVRPSFEDDSRPLYHFNAGRNLLQDALSNSNGCLSKIPKCEPGACATRNIQGVAHWVCLRCLSNYDPVVDSSGQDNIIQCVCSKGFYEAAPDATSCTRCPANSFCTGGDKVANPISRGSLSACGTMLITRNTGARTASDCVSSAGYAMTSPTGATPCARSTYAPQFNRLTRCMKCQGGLEEPLASNLTDGMRSSKRVVCKVPPGRYVSQGLVRVCPQGFYREKYVDFDADVAQKCLACNPGITTAGPSSKLAQDCNRVIPGYGIDAIFNVTSPSSIPAYPQAGPFGLSEAVVCQYGFYSAGGYCAQCPAGAVTKNLGAQTIEECAVPPGYYITSGIMIKCADGTYRDGWAMYSDSKAGNCTACGDNIRSEARELDQNPVADNNSMVRATSASCYIVAGQGMIAQAKNTFTAYDCPINTYGVYDTMYGLAAAPCKPCPRNMITDNQTMVRDPETCINPDGYGYATEGASRCAPAFYAAKGSRKPCKRCPAGRTTADDPNLQRNVWDCVVIPGAGVVGGRPIGGDVFNSDLTGLSQQQIIDLTVLQCPIGYWGGGDTLAAQCTKCPDGATTTEPGSLTIDDCNVCIAGRGKVDATAPCTLCDYGWWQPGGLAQCLPCPDATFYPPVDGIGARYTSAGVTFAKGATGIEWCVPKKSQLSPEAGQAYFSPTLDLTQYGTMFVDTATTLDACIGRCPIDTCCMAQFDNQANKCITAVLTPAARDDTDPQLFYKLPLSTITTASSVKDKRASGGTAVAASAAASAADAVTLLGVERANRRTPRIKPGTLKSFKLGVRNQVVGRHAAGAGSAFSTQSATASGGSSTSSSPPADGVVRAKMLSSALYARCTIPIPEVDLWGKLGTVLNTDARTFRKGAPVWLNNTNLYRCQELCDNSNVCWGGIYRNGSCLFRGGEDALNTRSFFSLPAAGVIADWLVPNGGSYYFTFNSHNVTASPLSDDARRDLYKDAVQAAVEQLNPYPNATAVAWVQQPDIPDTEIGVWFLDEDSSPIDSDLSGMFVGNATTTRLIALSLYQLAKDADCLEVLTTGVTIASTDGNKGFLGVPVFIDGCNLDPDYCSPNGSGTCSVSRCSCQPGWTGLRCLQAA